MHTADKYHHRLPARPWLPVLATLASVALLASACGGSSAAPSPRHVSERPVPPVERLLPTGPSGSQPRGGVYAPARRALLTHDGGTTSSTTIPTTTIAQTTTTTVTATATATATSTTSPTTTTTIGSTTTVATATSTTLSIPAASGLAGVIHVGGITSDHLIHPTAIILHWWGAVANSDIYSLVGSLMGQTGYYEPWVTKAQYLYNESHGINGHHLGVQFAVTQDGKMWQLTPYANSYAAHAACGNGWAVGIEIEGRGAADLHGDPTQFASVVKLVGELMRMFNIPLGGFVAANGLSGSGVLSHKMVDAHCYFADGSFAGVGKIDVDDAYLAQVKAALAQEGFH